MINSILFYFYLFCLNINIFCFKVFNNSQAKNKNESYKYFKSYNNTDKKNLIIGLIHNYTFDTILPFFESLIYANFQQCDIIMFVKNISQSIINYLNSIKVIILEIPEKYLYSPITSIRWKLYLDFFKQNKNKYKNVLITDIRDTIFQRDIFQYYRNIKSFLGVALEDGTLNEDFNKKWILDYVGEEKYKIIQNEKIVCFGTIWGTFDKILDLSNILWEKLKYNSNSTDQGIGNYLLYYEKLFKDFLIKSDNNGPVMTIGLTKRENIILDSHSNILNFKGEIAAIIHQYDRKPDIVAKIRRKFLLNNNIKIHYSDFIKKAVISEHNI